MKSERFMHIVVPRRGYSELATPDAPIKTRDRRAALRTPQANDARAFEEGLGVTVWETLPSSDDWWAVCTYLWKGLDEHQRPFISSHSCFLPSQNYAGYAAFFDSSILNPLRENVSPPESIDAGVISPLELPRPESSGHGISREELELLCRLTEIHDPRRDLRQSFLPRLLACVLAGVGFRMRVGEPSDATKLAVALLKIAALSGMAKPPRIATFMPRSGNSAQYPCQILPDSRIRGNSEFSSSGTPNETAQSEAKILAAAIELHSLDDLARAFQTVRNIAEVDLNSGGEASSGGQRQHEESQSSPTGENSAPILTGSASPETFERWRDALIAYEKKLNDQKSRQEAEGIGLKQREDKVRTSNNDLIQTRRELKALEGKIERDKQQLQHDQSQSRFWKAVSRIDELLQQRQINELLRKNKISTLKESSAEGLGKLLDRPGKEAKEELVKLLDGTSLVSDVSTIQNDIGGNASKSIGKAMGNLTSEKEKRDKKAQKR